MENIIDISLLLTPVEGDNPAGPDLRTILEPDSIYGKLREARGAARAIERANTGKKPDEQEPNPHWKKILELAPGALQQSKDLEIAAWLTEALLREYDFSGLAAGFELLHGLVVNFAEHLYPAPDEDDGAETTVAPLTGLNGSGSQGTLIVPINCVLITKVSGGPNYATWQYQQSADLARAPNEQARAEKIKSGVVKMEVLVKAALSTPKTFYDELLAHLNSAIENYDKLNQALQEKFPEHAPPSGNIENALRACRKAIMTIAKDLLENKEAAVEQHTDNTSTENNNINTTSPVVTSGSFNSADAMQNRSEAVKTLQSLADFFKRTEPHSPLGYGLDRLIRWANMGLPELLNELIADKQVQYEYTKYTGVVAPQPEPPIPPANYNAPYQPDGQMNPMQPNPMDFGNPMPPNPGFMDYSNNNGVMGFQNNNPFGVPPGQTPFGHNQF